MQPKYYGAVADYNKRGPGGGFQLDKRLLMMLAGGLVVIIFILIGFGLLNSATSAPKNDMQTLVAREQSLIKFIKDNQPQINSQSLAKIAAEASLLLESDQQSLLGQLSSEYGISEVDGSFVTAEDDTTSADTLKTAAAEGQFGQKMVQLLHDKLAATYSLASKIKDSSSGTLKAALGDTLTLLSTLDKELTDLKI